LAARPGPRPHPRCGRAHPAGAGAGGGPECCSAGVGACPCRWPHRQGVRRAARRASRTTTGLRPVDGRGPGGARRTQARICSAVRRNDLDPDSSTLR